MDAIHNKARYGGTSTEDEGKTEEATNDESDEDEELYGKTEEATSAANDEDEELYGKTEEATNDESGEGEEVYGRFGSLLLLQLLCDNRDMATRDMKTTRHQATSVNESLRAREAL